MVTHKQIMTHKPHHRVARRVGPRGMEFPNGDFGIIIETARPWDPSSEEVAVNVEITETSSKSPRKKGDVVPVFLKQEYLDNLVSHGNIKGQH